MFKYIEKSSKNTNNLKAIRSRLLGLVDSLDREEYTEEIIDNNYLQYLEKVARETHLLTLHLVDHNTDIMWEVNRKSGHFLSRLPRKEYTRILVKEMKAAFRKVLASKSES